MIREADHTIKGFVYQFNKTLEELLNCDEGVIVKVEGIVEDIDVISTDTCKAIQCKYHETKKDFNISDITKPVLQMLVHFLENKEKNVKYVLYAHFPNEPEGEKTIEKVIIEKMIGTQNKKYLANYISKIKPPEDNDIKTIIKKERKSNADLKNIKVYYSKNKEIPLAINIEDFLKPEKFKFIIGKSFQNLVEEIKILLEASCHFSKDDIEEIFYPNAIQKIAEKSIEPDGNKRTLEKRSFINDLEGTKKVAISRWTKELLSYKKLLKKRRSQLSENLKQNHRLRYFIFDTDNINEFEDEIVNFILNYLNKYHFKIKLHSKTPIFCFKTVTPDLLFNIEGRLYSKDISVTTGYKGKTFYEKAFLIEPKRIVKDNWFEFRLRLCTLDTEPINAINNQKCDDLFLIGNIKNEQLDFQDVNIEKIEVSDFKELKYLLSITNSID